MPKLNHLTVYLGEVSTRRSPLVHPERKKERLSVETNVAYEYLLMEELELPEGRQ